MYSLINSSTHFPFTDADEMVNGGVSQWTAVPMTLIYSFILITGIIGNIGTCIVIAKIKSMHTATNYYLFSLAISDLLLLILGLPQEIYQLWVPLPYTFGELFCVFRGLAAETSSNASVLLITAFTAERYLAICHPLRAHTWSKLTRALKVIGVIWLVAIVCALPVALQFGIIYQQPGIAECNVKHSLDPAFELSTFLFFCLPMTVISVLYILIGLKLRMPKSLHRSKGNNVCMLSSNEHTPPGSQQTLSSSRKAVLKMLVAVVVAFFICWAPFHAQRLLAIYASHPPSSVVIETYNILTYMSGVLYYISATINPILYHIMSRKFRRAFRDTCCCKNRQQTTPTTCFSLQRLPSNRNNADMTETTLVAKNLHDSISNSSLHVTDDDAYTPAELSSMMAEINEQRCVHVSESNRQI
uniref:G-protein coupled receptors family 1 profile domain-containing protein n=1 Tax=Strigamia maritima TaxID=126957 RepID=T1JHH5_STRMM